MSPEIASISGHLRQSIISMLEVYAPKSEVKAEQAMDIVKNNLLGLYIEKVSVK